MRARAAAGLLIVSVVALAVWACTTATHSAAPGTATVSTSAAATHPATTTAATTAPVGAPLSVTVKDLRNRKGNLIFGVFKSPAGFPNVEGKSIYWEVRDAGADALTFTTHLPPGRYAASVLHDENRSGDMDRGLGGIPLEGYGVTNNPKPALRAATYKEAEFDLPPAGAEMTISVQYF